MDVTLTDAVAYLGGGDIERGAAAVNRAVNVAGALDRTDNYARVYGRRAAIVKTRGYIAARAGGLADVWGAIAGATAGELAEVGIGL